jgi:hypothetical protein
MSAVPRPRYSFATSGLTSLTNVYSMVAWSPMTLSGITRRVLVVMGETAPASWRCVELLRSCALDVVAVAREREALSLLAAGEIPNAVLLLDSLGRRPDCFTDCARREEVPLDCIIDCIRRHRGLERVPVMHYTLDENSGLPLEELAALISAVAAPSDPAGDSAA